jgi:hypothetical protein
MRDRAPSDRTALPSLQSNGLEKAPCRQSVGRVVAIQRSPRWASCQRLRCQKIGRTKLSTKH